MLEQLKAVRSMLSAMAGTADLNELRKKVIEEAGETDEEGKPVAYESLAPKDRAGCDEAVATFQQMSGLFTDIIKAKARMTKQFFDALKAEGFDESQSLTIVAHQQAGVEAKG